MEIYLPENIFTRSFVNALAEDDKKKVAIKPASILSKSINENINSVGLIPTTEILSNKNIFVSKNFGISFEGPISNSYIYYLPDNKIDKIKVAGDVSSMDVILTKILFKELYDADYDITLQTSIDERLSDATVIVGDNNFVNNRFKQGISFAEELVEILSAPFVSFIMASNNADLLNEYVPKFKSAAGKLNKNFLTATGKFPQESVEFINENFDKVIYNLDEQDIIGIKELLQLPFYHGLIKDLTEIKFV
ncbi:hypothetical protein BMS3Abin03_02644 [bacterium BMS3Abin03]|nr:hypothetical protein BMS3Abin03_02644 [bacterium BMS3Abin03]